MYNTTFALLSFEGPDPYSSAGGLATRVSGLASDLAGMGYETHVFFVGDPSLPPTEVRLNGRLHLHRWCQWISANYRGGVYEGEEPKVEDWTRSLPDWMADNLLAEKVETGGNVVVLAEEWQTTQSVIVLRKIVEDRGWQDRVYLLWNANDIQSLDRIPWNDLERAAVITTVSRYMRGVLSQYGVEARVIPTGIVEAWLRELSLAQQQEVARGLFGRRLTLAKPDSSDGQAWRSALEAVAIMKRMGMRPLLLGAGGAHTSAIADAADNLDLSLIQCAGNFPSRGWVREALAKHESADVLLFGAGPNAAERPLVLRGAAAVLASTAREPFGITGLETMAAGGIAMVGCSGEDYSTPGFDSIALQTPDPWEIVHNVAALQDSAAKVAEIRKNARRTAARYTWNAVIRRCLLPVLSMIGVPRVDFALTTEMLRAVAVQGVTGQRARSLAQA